MSAGPTAGVLEEAAEARAAQIMNYLVFQTELFFLGVKQQYFMLCQ